LIARAFIAGPVSGGYSNKQKGNPRAGLVITEYSDFQCPSCGRMQGVLKDLLERYEGQIRLAFKHLPLARAHPHALSAARAAECAGAQQKFWEYHDLLFSRQAEWAKEKEPIAQYRTYARELKLDEERFLSCLKSPAIHAVIERDGQEAEVRQVNATPTFFIGSERLVGNQMGASGARLIEKWLRQEGNLR